MQKVVEKLAEQDYYFQHIAAKVSAIERRQSHTSGDTNDAIRAGHAYATGGSSCMPEKACKTVCDLIMRGETAVYWQEFLNKDIRRCEFELYKFFEAFCKYNLQAVVETQHSTGEPIMMLPSTRARLFQCNKDIDSKPPMLDMHLVELYKLTMPLDRGCNPTTVAELKARQILPKHSTYKTLAEEETAAVFKELKQKYPELAKIESILLPSLEDDRYENWHTKLLRKIRVWNAHTEQVVKAKVTMMEDEAYRAETAKAERIKAEYNTKTIEFWAKNDVEGQSAIKLANEIRKRWKDEEKSSVTEGEAAIKMDQSSSADSDASYQKEGL